MKRLFLVLTVVLTGLKGLAQVTMADVFRAMPEKEARLLTNNDRMDLLDFVASNMTARVANRLDEKSALDKLTDDYLHLTVTKISTMEMKLLPLKDTLQAVLVVKTVAGPAKDSVIKLFSTDWSEELDVNQYLIIPDTEAYWKMPMEAMTAKQKQVAVQLDPVLVEVVLSPDNRNITFQRSVGMLPKEEREIAAEILQPITVEWGNR